LLASTARPGTALHDAALDGVRLDGGDLDGGANLVTSARLDRGAGLDARRRSPALGC
jgi:hypothetical protein